MPSAAPARHVALLRAINVGGKNKLAMKDLAAVFAAAGCADVSTYIQSGNVVFSAGTKLASSLERVIPAALKARFGLEVPVILRSAAEIAAVARSNPFPRADPKALYVAFLRDEPSARRVADLDPERSPGDEFVVRGREIYIRFGASAAKTKLSVAWFDAELETVTTMRNRRTVETLRDLSA